MKQFIQFQIHSHETAADSDETNLLGAPFIKELCKFIGVSLQSIETFSADRGRTQRQITHGKVIHIFFITI